ncbi:MAG: ABC transporter ATP-binding protein, partial [Candidatus Bathyarchaeia archaeon]
MHDGLAVSLVHVGKSYDGGGKPLNVFEDITLGIKPREFVAVLGPTGSGKTTLLNLMTGMDKPVKGTIYVQGVNITKLQESELGKFRLRNLGVVHQCNTLIGDMSVSENVELPLVLLGVDKTTRRSVVAKLLKALGLTAVADRNSSVLSVGERQLVGIARAFASNTDIVIMDEPTECLDPTTTDIVMSVARSSNLFEGKTVIVTTHNRSVATMASRIVHL